jgi:proline racemase
MYRIVDVDESRRYVVEDLPETIPSIQLDYLSPIMKWGKGAAETYSNLDSKPSGIILMERADLDGSKVRSVTFDSDGEIVRSPGLGSTFAIFALHIEAGKKNTRLTNTSIYDSELTALVINEQTKQFSVETQGFITGMHEFVYDRDDPLRNGFLLK